MPQEQEPNYYTTTLIPQITTFVLNCMKDHDPSHNPSHIHRVVNLALKIFHAEQQRQQLSPSLNPASTTSTSTNPNKQKNDTDSPSFDPLVTVHLAALLHDIGDRKYLSQVQDQVNCSSATTGTEPTTPPIPADQMVERALLSYGCPAALAARVQTIVSHVSYTTECKDPERVRRLIADGYPELAIVQDADRLDAIGAVGVGRCFTFLGAKGKEMAEKHGGEWDMKEAIRHFGDKLERLEGMMKTETGRKMARTRTERLVMFREWWEEEVDDCRGTV